MRVRTVLRVSLLITGLSASAVGWADCGHAHHRYKEGEATCVNGFEFRCGAMGAWQKTSYECDAKSSAPPQAGREAPQQQSPAQQSPGALPGPPANR